MLVKSNMMLVNRFSYFYRKYRYAFNLNPEVMLWFMLTHTFKDARGYWSWT